MDQGKWNKDLMSAYGTKTLGFVEECIDFLDTNNFKNLFDQALKYDPFIMSNLIQLLDDVNIDWIHQVDFIPPCAYRWSVRKDAFEIPNNIKIIYAEAFACSDFHGVTIPISVMEIKANIFKGSPSMVVEYKGTRAQWEQIEKDPTWNKDDSINQIICRDGFITV